MKVRAVTGFVIALWLAAVPAVAQTPTTDAPDEQAAPAAPQTSECVPVCREEFVCTNGECVSACNPPCGAGEQCNALGRCVPTAAAPAAAPGGTAPLMVPQEPQYRPELGPGDPGWGYGAFVLGLVSAAAITGLTAGSAVTHGEPESAYLGLSALGLLAVSGPVVAFGGMSARSNPIHRGYPATRVLSWVGYGLTLTGGIALSVAGIDGDDVGPGWIAAAGIGGVLSMIGFSVDAFVSAEQAESPVGSLGAVRRKVEPSLVPQLAISPLRDGGGSATLGLAGAFF